MWKKTQRGSEGYLRVFLCHSSGDKQQIRTLYRRLKSDGFAPWLDENDILPGQDWQEEIASAVRSCDIVIVCLSRTSVTKEGFVQKEIKFALDVAQEKPEGTIFIIPVRLEEVSVPPSLKRWQWANLFEEDGYAKLMIALERRATTVGVAATINTTASSTSRDRIPNGLYERPTLRVGQPSPRQEILGSNSMANSSPKRDGGNWSRKLLYVVGLTLVGLGFTAGIIWFVRNYTRMKAPITPEKSSSAGSEPAPIKPLSKQTEISLPTEPGAYLLHDAKAGECFDSKLVKEVPGGEFSLSDLAGSCLAKDQLFLHRIAVDDISIHCECKKL